MRCPARRLALRKLGGAAGFIAAFLVFVAAAPAQFTDKLSHDTSLPIEISADSLEVQKNSKVATFSGNVDAVQGDLTIKADQLIVHYRNNETGAKSVSRIEAKGNVFLSSPDQTAQGDHGVYDIDGEAFELVGEVVLTRKENVIRGDRLTLDLATGQSRMESVATEPGGEGRVKALFVPKSGSE
ncbi:MAG: lipopolysaccharide transport periplasmic protein LptA [Alphaproteobacteria bacterium]